MHPDVVITQDPTLLYPVNVFEGADENAIVLTTAQGISGPGRAKPGSVRDTTPFPALRGPIYFCHLVPLVPGSRDIRSCRRSPARRRLISEPAGTGLMSGGKKEDSNGNPDRISR
jgi:hypothetical protein